MPWDQEPHLVLSNVDTSVPSDEKAPLPEPLPPGSCTKPGGIETMGRVARSVLVVEEDPRIRQVVKMTLFNQVLEVAEVQTCEGALERFSARAFDVIDAAGDPAVLRSPLGACCGRNAPAAVAGPVVVDLPVSPISVTPSPQDTFR